MKLSNDMLMYWSNFAKTGNPNGDNLTYWKEWKDDNEVFELGSNVGIIDDKYLELYQIYDEFLDV